MKKKIFFLPLFLFFTIILSCKSEKKIVLKDKYPKLKLTSRIIDYKDVKRGKILNAQYKFINPSEDTLKIKYVNPDCVCTGYTISSKVIPPKGKGVITLTLNTKEKYGENILHAVIKANTETKFYKITLKANIID
ncbi:hypothetical protein DS884_07405 [Tenacibaculum sp. E3R01]|uniref:DUF1573 domain-containing protein n=1 Tax=Tenacibaculum sp. E3R01 TaxID=2267227 RepID=UPI000DE88598|nr:DUF1573 domain-containing protein [Tenacibaculum sp. E3R01]RBW59553.1 hypothetical protein DS884_07405 [Tenacibaculum sp. E3R01]